MTDRDLRFADEYMVDFCPKQAAIRAGYSEKTARNAAAWIKPEKPAKPALRALIDRKIADMSRRTGITAERVMRELAAIAFADITDVVDPDTGKLLKDVSRSDSAAVAGIRVKTGDDFTEYDTKMCDKVKALELIGKHLGMFADNINVSGAVPVIIDDISADSPEDAPPKIGFDNG